MRWPSGPGQSWQKGFDASFVVFLVLGRGLSGGHLQQRNKGPPTRQAKALETTLKAKLYHNPRCSKSRATLNLLQEKGVDFEVIEYLKKGLQETEINEILSKLALPVKDIVRSGEAQFKTLQLNAQEAEDGQLIQAMVEHPILLQRPILVTDRGARIGRPPEQVLEVCNID